MIKIARATGLMNILIIGTKLKEHRTIYLSNQIFCFFQPFPRRLFFPNFSFFSDFFPIPPDGFIESLLWFPSAISTSANKSNLELKTCLSHLSYNIQHDMSYKRNKQLVMISKLGLTNGMIYKLVKKKIRLQFLSIQVSFNK